MKLVVGLGNPGRKYQGTRHNIGFDVLAAVARRCGNPPTKAKFHADTCEAELGGHKILLMTPLTYMNLSGTSVVEAKQFYKVEPCDILVVCDDLNLPLAKTRFRGKGSSGGQKGIEDIILRLGGDDFSRLRIGVGSPPEGRPWADFVLSRFSPEERAEIDATINLAAEAVEVWAREGVEYCMNKFN